MTFLKDGEKQTEKLKQIILLENRAQLPTKEYYNVLLTMWANSEIQHQSSTIMCLKDALEQLAIKYREYKAAHNRRLYQDMRNKMIKEEAFQELEKVSIAAKKFTTPMFQETPGMTPTGETPNGEAKEVKKEEEIKKERNKPDISEKEKKSIQDEHAMLQKLINSDLELIKQTQNRMVEISMLVRQFSVKAYEQEQLTDTSNLCAA